MHLSAPALLPLLSRRALHCPAGRISGLSLEHKKHSVAFPVTSAAAGEAAFCKPCSDCCAGKSHLQNGCVSPHLAQTGMSARPAKPCQRAMCCVRQSCTSLQGWAAHVPSHECICAAGTCSQPQQHEGCAPLYPPSQSLLPTPGNAWDPGAASHLNGAGSRGKGQDGN